jgi:hypothetical protein
MQRHEHYEELCALLPIGQLSAEEYQELAVHLRACPSCRHVTDDFSVILDKMPVDETDVDEKTLAALQSDSYRERFLKRAIGEGVPFSRSVMKSKSRVRKWSWPHLRLVPSFAVAAAVVIVMLSIQVARLSRESVQINERQIARIVPATSPTANNQSAQLISQLEAKVTALQSQIVEQQNGISDLTERLTASRGSSELANQQLARATEQLMRLQNEANDTRRALVSTNAELEGLRSQKDGLDATLVAQQIRINDLVAEVSEKEALRERERQLTAVAKDVRELMGERNLHILDVSDVDGNGRSKKPFGRVFLAEGKSLIFYAFDLGDRGNPAKVSFQAWGQLEGRNTTAKNLGVFYVDDHAQKRWVLKVTDPEKLTAINSLFVTVERLGGADKPTGRKLLYAYLDTQPNHP